MKPVKEFLSVKEQAMFSALDCDHLMEMSYGVAELYSTVAIKVFREGRTGRPVDSLRRCMNAFYNSSPNRNSHAWDSLITL